MTDTGWRAHIDDHALVRNAAGLYIARTYGDGTMEVMNPLTAHRSTVPGDGVARSDAPTPIYVPWDALEAIRAEIDRRLGEHVDGEPPPDPEPVPPVEGNPK